VLLPLADRAANVLLEIIVQAPLIALKPLAPVAISARLMDSPLPMLPVRPIIIIKIPAVLPALASPQHVPNAPLGLALVV
jgi:hypothetical protein